MLKQFKLPCLLSAAALATLSLSACMHDPNIAEDQRALGQEPSWQTQINAETAELELNYNDEVQTGPVTRAKTLEDGQQYRAKINGQKLTLTIQDGLCHDSMSGMPFPASASVKIGKQTLQGCAGDPKDLLVDTEWEVTQLNGQDLVTDKAPTLNFEADGVVGGNASCNNWRSQYALSGEGISFNQAASTMMACLPNINRQESQFLNILQAVQRFDINGRDELVLTTPKDQSITAIRK